MIGVGRIVASVACGAALLLFACRARVGVPSVAAEPPTLAELRNATYSGLEGSTRAVTLKDGCWEGEPYGPGGASRASVFFGGDLHVRGDLDGDGVPESVVVLARSSGGSGTVSYLAVVQRRNGALENVATTMLGDRVQVRTVRIEDGRLLVSGVRAGAGDAACCPGELVEWEWTLREGRLTASGAPRKTGRLSLDTLAGTEWVLDAWDLHEPAPPEPEVTLAYARGRFEGRSGCNRYFGAAKTGDMPGDLSVGPLAGTRMACPEPQLAIEARFLARLASAKKFGFVFGRLAISGETEGGGWGTMLFRGGEAGFARRP